MKKPSNKLQKPIGVIIAQKRSVPTIFEYSFILSPKEDNEQRARQGQYCFVYSKEEGGLMIGTIEQISVYNDYYANSQTIKNFEASQISLSDYFQSDEWECEVAKVHILGLVHFGRKINRIMQASNFQKGFPLHKLHLDDFKRIDKPGMPVKPGKRVFPLSGGYLRAFLGLNRYGLEIGDLKHGDLEITLDLDRLFRKHLAVLAQSGAGKSYLISILLEELLTRSTYDGTPAAILIDVHGEYKYLSEKPSSKLHFNSVDEEVLPFMELYKKINYFHGSFLQIDTGNLNEYDFLRYQPEISRVQVRELRKIINRCKNKVRKARSHCKKTSRKENSDENHKKEMKKETKTETEKENKKNSGKNIDKKSKDIKKSIYEQGYDISDIIDEVEMDPDINTNTKKALSGWLYDLQRLHIFGKSPAPLVKNLAKVGELTIIDLSPIISKRKKQILLHYITNKLFYMRRTERVPPFILFLEEAHNFIPESGGKHAIAKPIFEKMAREGRKFFAQLVLISQRPVHLSTTALSQCNTQIIMRITNPYDLDHIKSTSEALTRNSMKIINTLPTGNALIMGTALNFPVFVDVRERYIQDLYSHKSILDACKKFLKNPKGHSKVDLVRENDSNEEEEKDQNNWEDPSEQIMSEQKTNSGSKNFTFFDVLD